MTFMNGYRVLVALFIVFHLLAVIVDATKPSPTLKGAEARLPDWLAHLEEGISSHLAQIRTSKMGSVLNQYIYLSGLYQGWRFYAPRVPHEIPAISVREAHGTLYDSADKTNKSYIQSQWAYGVNHQLAILSVRRWTNRALNFELARFVRWIAGQKSEHPESELQLVLTKQILRSPFSTTPVLQPSSEEVIVRVKSPGSDE